MENLKKNSFFVIARCFKACLKISFGCELFNDSIQLENCSTEKVLRGKRSEKIVIIYKLEIGKSLYKEKEAANGIIKAKFPVGEKRIEKHFNLTGVSWQLT